MKLTENSIESFSALLASDAPAPGGGSAAALQGSLAASLLEMVTKLTIGRKKYAEHEELMTAVGKEAGSLRKKFIELIDKDTEAYNAVAAVFKMPKESEAEKIIRAETLEATLKGSTETPLEIMRTCLALLRLAEKMPGKFNTNAASDLGVAALSARAAICGAWLNVLINLKSIKDEDFTEKCRMEGQAMLDAGLPIAENIHKIVMESM
ncbi:MAG: cyclodeaminase/cyclohydrolase family protein [Treponema sp.]|nr:cyclodeaminase/cyclohydrolase family protein [Treponema sp.]